MIRSRLRTFVIFASTSALAATSLQVALAESAHAASAHTVWVSYPNNDSIEQGDGSLDLVNNFASSASSVTSSTTPLSSATAVTAVNTHLTALLHTSDGATGALPPNSTTQSTLGSTRIGVRPTSTIIEGAHQGLTLDLTETKPYLPSNSIGDNASQITNSPFMYFTLSVTNSGGSTSSPSSVYLGMDGACGAVMQNYPSAGSVAVPLCSGSDSGGTRYLVANTGSGVAAAVGSNLVSGFVANGAVSGSGSSGSAALSLQVPALSSGGSWTSTLVYGGWNTSGGIKSVGGSLMGFYYRQWFSNAAAMLSFAQQQQSAAISGSASFDANVTTIASDDASQYAASHAFRGWRHEQWLVASGSTPHYYVTEGAFGYLSTLDVAYEYEPLQTEYEPWKSKLELDEFAAQYETDSAGHRYLQHDVGQWAQLTAGAAYDLKSGTRKHMAVEHNLDFVAMVLLWESRTGQTFNRSTVQLLLNSVEAHDTNSDGLFDVANLTACRPDGTCRTEPLGTTYDGTSTAAAATEQGNTILGLKAGVVESIAAAQSYTAPGGGSLAAVAARHLSAEKPFIRDQSSDTALSASTKRPGYLSDALFYAPMLGSNATLDGSLPWIAQAIFDNHASVTSACTSCIERLSSGDASIWVSKALDGDVVNDWFAANYPSFARPPLNLPKVESVWLSRSGGLTSGTFESLSYPGQSYVRADYYPRQASIWASTFVGGAPVQQTGTISGRVTDTSGQPISGATVQACPQAGQACGISTVSAADGSYTLTVTPGTVFVWAQAAGFTDTYLGGGHSASDPLDSTTKVTAGSNTTVNLSMPSSSGPPPPPGGLFINAGSTSSYTDTAGNVWASDRNFSGGKTFTATARTIAGTPDSTLYLTQRYGAFTYSIPESAGTYQVTLKFAETADAEMAVGARVFSVQAEGSTVVSNLDIFSEVGGNTADDKTFNVAVSDGALSLAFIAGVQNPVVEGISVVAASGPPPSPGTVSGVVSSTAGGGVSGATVSVCPTAGAACGVTATTASNGSYSVSVPAGSYYVWAHATGFTDTYSGGGHSASDPADATVSVASGSTTTVSLSMPPTSGPAFTPVRINTGSTSSYTDTAGNVWASDRNFSGGKTFTATSRTIAGTPDSKLYLTQRYGAFTYSVAVPNGTYQVTLKFAETADAEMAVGARVFSVQAEGSTVLSNLDVFSEVGGNTADDKTFTVVVNDGALSLSFLAGVQNPMVEAIAVQAGV